MSMLFRNGRPVPRARPMPEPFLSPFRQALAALGITTREGVLTEFGSVSQARRALGFATPRTEPVQQRPARTPRRMADDVSRLF